MSRPYNKKNAAYWESRKSVPATAIVPIRELVANEIGVASDDNPRYSEAIAACGGGTPNSNYRDQWASTIRDTNRYQNIRNGIVPFDSSRDGFWGMGDAISLAMQAYFNVAAIRNAINMAVDFSVSPLHIKSVNETAKRFFTNWFESINLSGFMSQYFLEYYRSGNVFMYKFMGRLPEDSFNKLKVAIAAKSPELPIRYILLNPQQVYLQMGPSYNYTFSKMLSTYEIQRLKNPITEEDKLVFKSLPKPVQQQIMNYSAQPYIYIPLDTGRLYYSFYRKQDYEPLAVPMIFPVLADVDWKLELKKLDMSLVRSMEQMILHISTGAPADSHNPAIGKKNIEMLTNIMRSQTVGRTLITDWTTKLEWKIPDLKQLLGPEKYERVDADIKEGLQYMFFGQEKFANAAIKAKIFVAGLREGRRCFLDNFLRPEVKKVCEAMNFKNVPTLEFEEIDITDQTAMNGLYYKMAQLGLLTNDELNNVLNHGVLPDKDDSVKHQEEYKSLRDKGLYSPIVPPMAPTGGAAPKMAGNAGRPPGISTPLSKRTTTPIGGKTKASYNIDNLTVDGLVETIASMNTVRHNVEKALCKKYKLKKLDANQLFVADGTAKSIVVNESANKWQESIASYTKTFKGIDQEAANVIDSIAAEFDYGPWEAIAVYKAQLAEKV